MTMTIDAVYEASAFRPLVPVELPEGKRVRLTINIGDGATNLLPEPDPSRVAEIMAEIAALAVRHGEPETASRDHDKILYGGPDGVR